MEPDPYPKVSRGWTGVGVLFALYTLSMMDRQALNLLVDPVREVLKISDVQMSFLLGGSFAIFYGLVGLPLARLADTSNRRNLIVFGVFLWGCCTILSGFAYSFLVLALLRVGLALGEAVLSPSAYSMIADWFPPSRRAFPTTVYSWGNGFGSKFGMMIMGVIVLVVIEKKELNQISFLSDFEPWQLMFFVIGILTLLVGSIFALTIKEPLRIFADGQQKAPPSLSVLRTHIGENRNLYAGLLVGCGLNKMAYIAIAIWAPQLMKRNYGWEISHSAITLGILVAVTGIVGYMGLPRLSDIIRDRLRQPEVPIWIAIILAITGCGCLAGAPLAPTATWFLILYGAGVPLSIGSSMLAISSVPIIAPPRMRAILISIYLMISSALTTTLAPTMAALFAEHLFASQGSRALAAGVAMVAALTPLFSVSLLFISRRAYADALRRHLPSMVPTHLETPRPDPFPSNME